MPKKKGPTRRAKAGGGTVKKTGAPAGDQGGGVVSPLRTCPNCTLGYLPNGDICPLCKGKDRMSASRVTVTPVRFIGDLRGTAGLRGEQEATPPKAVLGRIEN